MKKRYYILFALVLLVTMLILGTTYAYYKTKINGNSKDKSISVLSKYLAVKYSDGTSTMNFDGDYFFPGDSAEKTFSVENTGNDKTTYSIKIDNVINEFERIQDIRYKLYINEEEVSSGAINNSETQYLYYEREIEKGIKDNIKLVVSYGETEESQNVDMNKTLSIRVNIDNKKENKTSGSSVTFLGNGNPIENYRIYGNSVQNEFTGKNLLNTNLWENPESYNGITVQYLKDEDCFVINGTTLKTAEIGRRYLNIKIDNTKTYSFSLEYISGTIDRSNSTSEYKHAVAYLGDSNTINQAANWKAINLEEENQKRDSVTTSKNYITAMWFYMNDNIVFNNYKFRLQLEKNNVASDYESYKPTPSPEYPSEIESVGDLVTDTNSENYGKYKIPITINSKNLITAKEFYAELKNRINSSTNKSYYEEGNVDGRNYIRFVDNNDFDYTKVKFKNNTQYTISFDYKQEVHYAGLSNKHASLFTFFYTDGTHSSVLVSSTTTQGWKHTSLTSKANKTIKFIGTTSYNYYYKNYIDIDTFQLEEGTKETEYEPYYEQTTNIYLDEPLRKIGDYADYIDFREQKVVRKIKSLNLSTEYVSRVGSNGGSLSLFNYIPQDRLLLTGAKDNIQLLSNKLKSISYSNYISTFYNTTDSLTYNFNNKAIFFKIKKDTVGITSDMSETDKKTKINEYLTNNPITVNYILETPIEKNIYLESIKSLKGYNAIRVNTNVESKVSIQN